MTHRFGLRFRTGRSRYGYTLIELLLVVGLLGLAGAIVVPSLQNEDDTDVQAAVRKLIGDLSFAQSDSVARQEFRRVHFFEDGSGYAIERVTSATIDTEFDPLNADYIRDPLGSPGSLGRYIVNYSVDNRFRNVSISEVAIDTDKRQLVYDSLGGTVIGAGSTPSAGGTIEINAADTTYRITVSAFTGKLSVERLDP
ncbi:MAG: prepilin-type N-terminal cleavage/methylation domain-containing protein [Phycisphaerales bacterium]